MFEWEVGFAAVFFLVEVSHIGLPTLLVSSELLRPVNGHVMLRSVLSSRVLSVVRRLSTAQPSNLYEWEQQYFTADEKSPLDSWLVSNLSTFSDEKMIELFRTYIKHQDTPISPPVGIALDSEIRARVSTNNMQHWRLLYQASKISERLSKAGSNLIPVAEEMTAKYVSAQVFLNQPFKLSATILGLISNLHQTAPSPKPMFLTATGESVFDIATKTFPGLVRKFTVTETGYWFMVLRSAILQHWGSEDFLCSLEQRLLQHMPILPIPSFISLPLTYSERLCRDYTYLMNCYQQPFCRELQRRALRLGPSILTNVISSLTSTKNSPLYWDEEFEAFLARSIRASNWLKGRDTMLSLTSEVIKLVGRISPPAESPLLAVIRRQLQSCASHLTIYNFPYIARDYSLLPVKDKDFWNAYVERLPVISKRNSARNLLYSTMLNLSVHNPEVYKRCMEIQELQRLLPTLKEARLIHFRHFSKTWMESSVCQEVASYLQSSGLEYEKEYFDEYYIDFAFPKMKLAVDVCTNQHYVLPEMTLNGQKKVKKAVLESKGWRYEVLQLINHPTASEITAKAKEFFSVQTTQPQ